MPHEYLSTRKVTKNGIGVSTLTQSYLVDVGMDVIAITRAKMIARPNSKNYS